MTNQNIKTILNRYAKSKIGEQTKIREILQNAALLGLERHGFFEKAAFYGGTALRILYNLNRFSEDLDFSLLKPNKDFQLAKYNAAIKAELQSFGFTISVETKQKSTVSNIKSAFIKAGTKVEMLKILVPPQIVRRIHKDSSLKIKLEIDVDPPGNFTTEVKALLRPIPFYVKTLQQPDLFAGKVHAILCRNWQTRVKGRDWYDLVWYISNNIPLRIRHLQARLTQNQTLQEPLTHEQIITLLNNKIDKVDFKYAQQEVRPFLQDTDSVAIWSKDFFREIIAQIQTL